MDAVVTEKLIVLLTGDRTAQIRKNDVDFTLIDTITRTNGQVISIDLIEEQGWYDVYAIIQFLESSPHSQEIVKRRVPKPSEPSSNEYIDHSAYRNILVNYPENCADMMRATHQLLIIDCSNNGHTLILRRHNMTV